MRIFNEAKTIELTEYDETRGYIKPDKLFIAHHPATEEVEEVGHYVTVKVFPNGGKEVKWVVDKPAAAACEEHDEYEDILVFIPYTEEELAKMAAQKEISELKQKLKETDYKAIKYAEGELSAEEYAPTKAERRAWREKINQLESEMGGLSDG